MVFCFRLLSLRFLLPPDSFTAELEERDVELLSLDDDDLEFVADAVELLLLLLLLDVVDCEAVGLADEYKAAEFEEELSAGEDDDVAFLP